MARDRGSPFTPSTIRPCCHRTEPSPAGTWFSTPQVPTRLPLPLPLPAGGLLCHSEICWGHRWETLPLTGASCCTGMVGSWDTEAGGSARCSGRGWDQVGRGQVPRHGWAAGSELMASIQTDRQTDARVSSLCPLPGLGAATPSWRWVHSAPSSGLYHSSLSDTRLPEQHGQEHLVCQSAQRETGTRQEDKEPAWKRSPGLEQHNKD